MTEKSDRRKASAGHKALNLDTYDVRFLAKLAAWKLADGWAFDGTPFVGRGIRADDLADKGYVDTDLKLASYAGSSGSAVYKKAYRISEKGKAALLVETGEDAKGFRVRWGTTKERAAAGSDETGGS